MKFKPGEGVLYHSDHCLVLASKDLGHLAAKGQLLYPEDNYDYIIVNSELNHEPNSFAPLIRVYEKDVKSERDYDMAHFRS